MLLNSKTISKPVDASDLQKYIYKWFRKKSKVSSRVKGEI